MSDNFKKILIAGASIVVALAIAFIAGQRDALNRLVLPQEERVDTLFLFDTIVSENAVLKEKKVVETILVPVKDTIWLRDTLYIPVDREQLHWKDAYSEVYASGMAVEIDSVIHYLPVKVVTKERDVMVKVKPKWSIGVQAGYGAFPYDRQIVTSPYVGIGLSYNFLSW